MLRRYAFLLVACFAVMLAGCDAVSSEPEYTQATITSVVLVDMPFAKDNGSAWDVGSGPDVYLGLYDGNEDPVSFGTTFDGTAPSDLPLSWGIGHTVYNLGEPHSVGFWDDDYDADDYIGGVRFTLDDYKDDAPPSFALRTSRNLEVKVTLEWTE